MDTPSESGLGDAAWLDGPQVVRDLAWVVSSPSLIVPLSGEDVPNLPELDPAGIDADDLTAFLSRASIRRVGHYFEGLVRYYLERVRRFETIAAGVQIYEDKQTMGEIDFIFRDRGGDLHHWETAVKFFLHLDEPSPIGSHWIGPNPADTFERKMHRMFEHQLPLSRRRFPEVVYRSAMVRGRIFYHRGRKTRTTLPARLSPQHLQASWIRCCELEWLEDYPSAARFRLIRKPFWLSPDVCRADEPSLLSAARMSDMLRLHFARSRAPQLITALTPKTAHYREIDRVFIVDDAWPR